MVPKTLNKPAWLAFVCSKADDIHGDANEIESLWKVLEQHARLEEDQDIKDWLKEVNCQGLVLMLPKTMNSGTVIMHHITNAEVLYGRDSGVSGSFLGIAGLAGTAPLKLLKYKVLNNSLAAKSQITKSVMELQVPTLSEIHKAIENGVKVAEFQSKSGKTIQRWKDKKMIRVWHPKLLGFVLSIGGHTIKHVAIINGVVRALEEAEETGEGFIDPTLMGQWKEMSGCSGLGRYSAAPAQRR